MQPIAAPQPQSDREWLTLIHTTLCEVRADVAQLKQQHHEAIAGLITKQDKQDGRIRRLELWQARLAGGLLVVAFMATYAVWPLVKQLLKLAP